MRTACVMRPSDVMCASRVNWNTSHHCDHREQHHCAERHNITCPTGQTSLCKADVFAFTYALRLLTPEQHTRPPPVADEGSVCWRSGRQMSAALQAACRCRAPQECKQRRSLCAKRFKSGPRNHDQRLDKTTCQACFLCFFAFKLIRNYSDLFLFSPLFLDGFWSVF